MANTSALLKVRSDLKNLSKIRGFVKEAAETVGLSEQAVSELRLAVDEACANIIQHGYKNLVGDLEVSVTRDSHKLVVTLTDSAPPYNPLKEPPAPDLDVPLDERPLGGMGVMLIKQNTDAVEYQATKSGGNALILTKQLLNS